ncbi:MAG TPA: YihY/virulence factor BrkB family protein [Bdellovibrionales bacterium]|nr:YihY/virulence factor BrkB family protein [Bdellovibrionales bacterium]
MRLRNFLANFIDKFFQDETTTLAASLAFYMSLSLAPLLILFVSISSRLSADLQYDFIQQVGIQIGPEAARAVEMVIDGAKTRPDLSSIAGTLGVLTLLVSASLIFGELRTALNKIFAVPARQPRYAGFFGIVLSYLRERALHVALAVGFILVLIASVLASSLISLTLTAEFKSVARAINIGVTVIFYVCLYSLMYRYLPDRRQPWRRALQGGALTALLFVVGKELIALYMGKSAIASPYGAAGSVIALMIWVYYSTLITFVGAQVSTILLPARRRTA